MDKYKLANIIEHTNIKAEASLKDIRKLCREAARYKFGLICINPVYVKQAGRELKGTNVLISAVCGFPSGAHKTSVKIYEAEKAVKDGAMHIDMVMNIGALKSRDYKLVETDIKSIIGLGAITKIILEMPLLTNNEKRTACKIASECGADFLKTGTGLKGRALVSDVKLMARYGRVKAAGGIHTYEQAVRFINAGASKIGTSRGVEIINDCEKNTNISKAR